MKTLKEGHSPILTAEITQANYEKATAADSGGCLVADAIEDKYPQYKADVDVATIQIKDRARGVKYIYLTPPRIGNVLLGFDQGWREEDLPIKLRLANAVKIVKITRSRSSKKATAERRAARLAELEQKEKSGAILTSVEKRSLTKLRNPKPSSERPETGGPQLIVTTSDGKSVVAGGTPLKKPLNPNLLRGRNRLFGAKTATPSKVFQTALKTELKKALEAETAPKQMELES